MNVKKVECILDTGWALLLWASRLAGVAPVQLVKLCNGYSVSVSHSYTVYSKILITLINLAGIIGVTINFLKKGIQIKFRSTFFWVSHNMAITSAMALVGSYRSARRMKTMIENMNIIDQVKRSIGSDCTIPLKSIETRKTLLLLCSIIFVFNSITAHLLIGNCILVKKHIYSYGKLFFYLHQIVYITKLFLEYQMMCLALHVSVTFKLLNQKLEGMLCLTGSAKTKEISTYMRTLTKSYVSLCEVAFKMNKDDGFLMFLSVFDTIDSLLLNGHIFFINLLLDNSWFHYATLMICFFYAAKIMLFIENYHRIFKEVRLQDPLLYTAREGFVTSEYLNKIRIAAQIGTVPLTLQIAILEAQATDTRVIVSKLIYHLTGVGQRMPIELELMFKQLILNVPQYSPLGIFSFKRSNIITVFSVISTCAVYLLQINVSNS